MGAQRINKSDRPASRRTPPQVCASLFVLLLAVGRGRSGLGVLFLNVEAGRRAVVAAVNIGQLEAPLVVLIRRCPGRFGHAHRHWLLVRRVGSAIIQGSGFGPTR